MPLSLQASLVSQVFCVALVASLAVKFWLATRQMRHVQQHRATVPAAFASTISTEAHQLAADYTLAKTRLGLLGEALGTALLLGWTLLGGLDALNAWVHGLVAPGWGDLAYQLALFGAFSLIGGLLDLPLEWYRTFHIEQQFGFNRMTPKLFVLDLLKGTLVGLAIGTPLLAAVLWVMGATGQWWWLWAWALWTGFMLLITPALP